MYAPLPSFVLGFHGCDEKVKQKVLNGDERLINSDNEYDWLGNGVYFWEHNPERAIEFAIDVQENPGKHKTKVDNPTVIGAVIDLGCCLNLLNSEYIQIVKQTYDNLVEISKSAGIPLPKNTHKDENGIPQKRNLDCAVIQTLHAMKKKNKERSFDSVRAVFIEGQPIYEESGFNKKSHIQICVANPNCIKGYFSPLRNNPDFPVLE